MRRRGSQFLVFKCVTALAFALMAALFVPCVSYAQVSVQPQAFVPNWDGENDTTHVTWSMQQAALVRVIVVDKDSGKIHRVLVDEQVMEAGLHETWWDGRDQSGKVMAAKNWLIKVEGASNTSSADTIQSANSGELSDINSAIVTLKEAPVSIRSIRMSNAFIGTATHNSRIVGKFSVSASSNVASVVIDSSGRIVRSFQTKVVNAGDTSLTWDGKSSRGRNVQDGNYTLLVAASGLGRPSNTLRMPIRIDRHVPKMMLARSIRAEVSRTNVVVPINFRVNENATMVVSLGGKKVSWKYDPKVKIVKLNGSSLGLRPAKSMKRVNLIVRAMDSSKNVTSKKVLLVIPPMQRSNRSVKPISKPVITPTTETDTSTDTVPTPSVGKLRWPVSGPVTSNFGLREGRMHQGIDIGVPTGTEVHAVLAGVVESAGTMDGYGIQVTLIHSNGLSTRYAHLSKIALGLVAGDQVSTGQVIGSSGCTGRCFGDHLHFETRINQIAENPLVRLS